MSPTDRINKRPDLTPDGLNEQERLIQEALAAESGAPLAISPRREITDPEFPASPPSADRPDPRPRSPVAALRERERPRQKVVIHHSQLGTITLPALSVSVSASAVGFFMDDQFGFEPKVKAQFVIEIGKDKMPVIYAGGFFHFKEERLVMLSFLRYEAEDEVKG